MKIFTQSTLIAVAFLVSITSFAQKKGDPIIEAPTFVIEEETQKVIYKEVVEQKGSPATLYDKAFAWAMKYYKNPTSVIREKDKEKGSLKAKARFYVFYTDLKTGKKTRTHTIEYDLSIKFKEGRYRYEITNIIYKATSYQGIEQWIEANNKQYNYRTASHLVQVDREVKKVINSFKSAVAKEEKTVEEW